MKHKERYQLEDCDDVDYSFMDDGDVMFDIEGRIYRVDFRAWIYEDVDTVVLDKPAFDLTITKEAKKEMLEAIQENKGDDDDVKFNWER